MRCPRLQTALFGFLLFPLYAGAATIRGSVKLAPTPAPPTSDSAPAPLGLWRIDNGRIPIASAETRLPVPAVIILVPEGGAGGAAATEEHVTLQGFAFSPAIVAAPLGSTFVVHNSGTTPRTFYLEDGENLMPRQLSPPGDKRDLKLTVAGEYHVRDADYPDTQATLLLIDSPYSTVTDDNGEFTVEVPSGRYLLRVYAAGSWRPGQRVEAGKTQTPLRIVVPSTPARAAKSGATPPSPPQER